MEALRRLLLVLAMGWCVFVLGLTTMFLSPQFSLWTFLIGVAAAVGPAAAVWWIAQGLKK